MSELADAKAAVVTILEGLSCVGIVHDDDRLLHDPAAADENFIVAQKVDCWFVVARAMSSVRHACGEKEARYEITITGFKQVEDDESSSFAENAQEDVEQALFANPRLTNTVTYSDEPDPQPIDAVSFNVSHGAVRCHRIVVKVQVQERSVISY